MEIARQKRKAHIKKRRPRKLKTTEAQRWELMQAYWHTELIGRKQVQELCSDYGVGPGYARWLVHSQYGNPGIPRGRKRKISVEAEHQLIQAYLHKPLIGQRAVQDLCEEFGVSRGYAASRALELYGIRITSRGYKNKPVRRNTRVNPRDPRWDRARAALVAGMSPDEWVVAQREAGER